jgi:hypothetical protein
MKEKKPGDHIILRLKKTESPEVLEWINKQSNLSDAIRYLIEGDIQNYSIRDLQEHIPAKRNPKQHPVSVPDHVAAKPVAVTEEDKTELVASGPRETVTQQSRQVKQTQEPQQENQEENYSDELIDHWMNI